MTAIVCVAAVALGVAGIAVRSDRVGFALHLVAAGCIGVLAAARFGTWAL